MRPTHTHTQARTADRHTYTYTPSHMGDTACLKCYARIQTQPTELTRISPRAHILPHKRCTTYVVQHGERGPAAAQALLKVEAFAFQHHCEFSEGPKSDEDGNLTAPDSLHVHKCSVLEYKRNERHKTNRCNAESCIFNPNHLFQLREMFLTELTEVSSGIFLRLHVKIQIPALNNVLTILTTTTT